MNWTTLVPRLLALCVQGNSVREITTSQRVCRRWNQVLQDDIVWKPMTCRDWSCLPTSVKEKWKQAYMDRWICERNLRNMQYQVKTLDGELWTRACALTTNSEMNLVAVGHFDGWIRMWNFTRHTQYLVRQIRVHGLPNNLVLVHPSTLVVTSSNLDTHTVQIDVLDLPQDDKQECSVIGHKMIKNTGTANFPFLHFAADAKRVVYSFFGELPNTSVACWNVDTGIERQTPDAYQWTSITIDRKRSILYAADNSMRTISLFDLDTIKSMKDVMLHGVPCSIRVDPILHHLYVTTVSRRYVMPHKDAPPSQLLVFDVHTRADLKQIQTRNVLNDTPIHLGASRDCLLFMHAPWGKEWTEPCFESINKLDVQDVYGCTTLQQAEFDSVGTKCFLQSLGFIELVRNKGAAWQNTRLQVLVFS